MAIPSGGLELRLEGEVVNHSGKLLIIDPAYLKDFDFKPVDRLNNDYFDWLMSISEVEDNYAKSILRSTRECLDSSQALLRGDLEVGLNYNPVDLVALEKEKREKIAALRQKPFFAPPYIAQGDGYVLFNNVVGDGRYPIVQTSQRIYVMHNYQSISNDNDEIELDKSRLDGTLIGFSSVDSAVQIIIDADRVTVKETISPELYGVVSSQGKIYKCKFIKGNSTLALRKVS